MTECTYFTSAQYRGAVFTVCGRHNYCWSWSEYISTPLRHVSSTWPVCILVLALNLGFPFRGFVSHMSPKLATCSLSPRPSVSYTHHILTRVVCPPDPQYHTHTRQTTCSKLWRHMVCVWYWGSGGQTTCSKLWRHMVCVWYRGSHTTFLLAVLLRIWKWN